MYKQEKGSNLGYIRQDTQIGEKSNYESQIQPSRDGLYDLEIDNSSLYEQLSYKSRGKYRQIDLLIDLHKSNEKHSFQAKTHDFSYRERSKNETSKRLVDRIQFATINLYNYNKIAYQTNNQSEKAYNKKNKNKTCAGHTLEIAQCKYLAVIDIDIDHEEILDVSQRETIRNSIIQLFQPAKQQDFEGCNVNPEDESFMMKKYNQHRNVGLVKSARGGLHIYCNIGPYKLQQNSMVNVIVTKDFSVDVFACVDAMSNRLMDEEIDVEDRNKTRRIVQSGTQIQKYRNSKRKPLNPEIKQKLQTGELRNSILTYQDLNNAYEKTNLAEIQDVFLILGFDIKVIQRDDKKLEKIEERQSCLEKCEMTKEQTEILVHGLDYTIIHTNHPHAEGELSLFTLCTYINGLRSIDDVDEDFINECYNYIEENCDYSLQAQTCFQAHRERNSEKQQSPYCQQGFIKKFKLEYYSQQFIPQLAAKKKQRSGSSTAATVLPTSFAQSDIDFEKIQVHNIDIKEQFGLDDIIHKIGVKPYDCVEEIISDLTKIPKIQKQGSEVVYLLKQSRKQKKPPQINVFQGLQDKTIEQIENIVEDVEDDDEQPQNNSFYETQRDISTVNLREIPLTQAKKDIIEASLTDVDIFIRDHFTELKDGMNTASALSQKPINIADKTFQIEIKQKCEYKITQIKKIRHYSYKLKQEFIPHFEKLHGEYSETIDKGFNEWEFIVRLRNELIKTIHQWRHFPLLGADDTVVLLGAGGTKPISEFAGTPTDLSDYYTKTQTYSKTETDNKYVRLDGSIQQTITGRLKYVSPFGQTQDETQDPVANTYLTMSEVDSKLTNYVNTTNNQEINGTKTFNSNINAAGFAKTGKDDTSVLLAGGGDRLLSSFGGIEDLTSSAFSGMNGAVIQYKLIRIGNLYIFSLLAKGGNYNMGTFNPEYLVQDDVAVCTYIPFPNHTVDKGGYVIITHSNGLIACKSTTNTYIQCASASWFK
ncbi:MAG: hypothetical protein EZS28_014779 [Streblomastix strix]|uniref:Uncharacterized protein n=1 Tax=Streblomastix strix TaxID=222440 RepID=A0A5J4W509_9EUKA|nr:MAG: hypothetical protein EZS28_014779 [Streblomastix strix]